MKNLFGFLFFVCVFVSAGQANIMSAQEIKGELVAKSREEMLRKLPVEVAYWYPEFVDATVFYNNKTRTTSVLNLCTVDNTLRFINPAGDTLVAGNMDQIHSIMVNDTLMFKHEDYFLKEIIRSGNICLAERRIFTYTEPELDDVGYSMAPATSTAKKVNIREYDDVRLYGFEAEIDWRLDTKYVLTDGRKYYFVKKSAFEKIFPNKKDFIRTFVKMNGTDFEDRDDVVSLFKNCIEEN